MQKDAGLEKILIIGGRRGLGGAVSQLWRQQFPNHEIIATTRREDLRKGWNPGFETHICDLSVGDDVNRLADLIKEWQPTRFFCFAGGGPYGSFVDKEWKDHVWALKVSLLNPLRLTHDFLRVSPEGQVILVGSAIAESEGDSNAASYAAAKHALKGLVSSVKKEAPDCDLRLFSPGYMDTDMLPAHALPRTQNKLQSPQEVAAEFVKWASDPQASWHKVCRP